MNISVERIYWKNGQPKLIKIRDDCKEELIRNISYTLNFTDKNVLLSDPD